MNNPWDSIPLSDYENHMALDSVRQLQTMNDLMADQFARYPVRSAMVLGVAGGNGLEHVDPSRLETVWGVDLNGDYLAACAARYRNLEGTLHLLRADLTDEALALPQADLVIANLLVEYIGYPCFQRVLRQVAPRYVSCVIQLNTGDGFVSDSPYLHAFDGLSAVHHQMEEAALTAALAAAGYAPVFREERPLPNGKQLLRLDHTVENPT